MSTISFPPASHTRDFAERFPRRCALYSPFPYLFPPALLSLYQSARRGTVATRYPNVPYANPLDVAVGTSHIVLYSRTPPIHSPLPVSATYRSYSRPFPHPVRVGYNPGPFPLGACGTLLVRLIILHHISLPASRAPHTRQHILRIHLAPRPPARLPRRAFNDASPLCSMGVLAWHAALVVCTALALPGAEKAPMGTLLFADAPSYIASRAAFPLFIHTHLQIPL